MMVNHAALDAALQNLAHNAGNSSHPLGPLYYRLHDSEVVSVTL